MKRQVILGIGIALLMVFGAFTNSFAENVIRFGSSLSLTGNLAGEGRSTKDGYEFYQKKINERGGLNVNGKKYKVSITYLDDESNLQSCTKLIEKLVTQEKIDFLLGPYGSGPGFAASVVSERYKKIMILPMATTSAIYERGFKYLFGIAAPPSDYLRSIIAVAAEQKPKPKTVAILWSNHRAHAAVVETLPGLCKEAGLKIIYNEKYPLSATDWGAEFSTIRNLNPDIFMFMAHLEATVTAIKQVKGANVNPNMLVCGVSVAQHEFPLSLGKDAEHIVGPTHWYRTVSFKDALFTNSLTYAKEFEKEYGYSPDYHSASATAAAEIFGLAIEKAGSIDTEKILHAFRNLDEITFWGPVSFDKNGLIKGRAMMAGQIQNGKFVIIHPHDAANAKFIYPKLKW